MSETGELPCIYCGTEPPPLDDYGRVSCCQAGRDVSEMSATVNSLAKALNFYADPRGYDSGEVMKAGRRYPNAVAADAGDLAVTVLNIEHRLDGHVADLLAAARGEPVDFVF